MGVNEVVRIMVEGLFVVVVFGCFLGVSFL